MKTALLAALERQRSHRARCGAHAGSGRGASLVVHGGGINGHHASRLLPGLLRPSVHAPLVCWRGARARREQPYEDLAIASAKTGKVVKSCTGRAPCKPRHGIPQTGSGRLPWAAPQRRSARPALKAPPLYCQLLLQHRAPQAQSCSAALEAAMQIRTAPPSSCLPGPCSKPPCGLIPEFVLCGLRPGQGEAVCFQQL